MAEAIWIINLTSEDKYHDTFKELQVNYQASTNFEFAELRYDRYSGKANSLEQRISDFITNNLQKLPIVWPHFANLQENDILRIYLIGDINERTTLELFHLLPTEIRRYQQTLAAVTTQVKITGLLSYNYDINQKLSDEQVLFLSQLNMLQRNTTTSLRPCWEIFLFQKPANNPELHYFRISQFLLYSVIGRFYHTNDYSYNEAGCAGVYFERDIQEHNESATLVAILLNSFNFGNSSVFLCTADAEALIKNSAIAKNNKLAFVTLTERIKKHSIELDFKLASKTRSLDPVKSMLDPDIITNYYRGFIPRIIQRLVNTIGTRTINAYEKFLIALNQNKRSILNGSNTEAGLKDQLTNLMFSIFKNPDSKCSLEQQRHSIKELKSYIRLKKEDFAQNQTQNEELARAFVVTPELEHAYNRAQQYLISEEQVLRDLESNLQNHPVISAKLIRTGILVFTLAILIGPVLAWIAANKLIDLGTVEITTWILIAFCFFVPLYIAASQIKWLLNQIDTSQKEYKACLLFRINEKSKVEIINAISEIYNDLLNHCDLLENRRQQTEKKLRPFRFYDNAFKSNELFQPLWVSQATNTDERSIHIDLGRSGQFNGKDILNSFPGYQLTDINGNLHFLDLLRNEEKIMHLIRKLMKQPATDILGADTQFTHTSTLNAILLLDISGSMNEKMPDGKSKIEHLQKAVKEINAEDIAWVAFSDDVYSGSNGQTIFKKNDRIPDPQGGTELHKGFIHLINNRNLGFEKVILISDGWPFTPEKAISQANNLRIPVDVIYIGTDEYGKSYMQKLADNTGGKMVVASDVDLTDSLNAAITIDIQGREEAMEFWELLQLGHFSGCAQVAQDFAKSMIITANMTTTQLLESHFNEEGIKTWVNVSKPTCGLQPGLPSNSIQTFYTGQTPINNQNLNIHISGRHDLTLDDSIIEIVQLRELSGLNQLLIKMDAKNEAEVFKNNKNVETTKLCKTYLKDSDISPIFIVNNQLFNKVKN